MIGSTLLHYTVDARLGEGGMGMVYRARDTVLDRTVAIKVLAGGDEEATRRLLHEARAASAFSHPNSVTIHAVEQHDDRAFIVMEHVDGVPLDAAIPAGGLPIDVALRYGCEMADVLASAHAQGIVHRDIKPRNVMITATGHVKVLDFGIARRTALPADATRVPTLDRTLSTPGSAIGTPGFMAPEQVTGQPASPRSDVFALGAVLFQMISGGAPFTGDSAWALVDATLHHEPPPLTKLAPATPPALARIVARCLAKDPAARFASGGEVLAALEAVRRDRAGAGPSRAPYWRAAVVVLLVVIVAGATAFWRARTRENEARWVREVAIPEIGRLTSSGDAVAAYRLARQVRASAPDDPLVEAAWNDATQPFTVTSDPPGAAVALRSLSGQDEGWIPLGTTPVTTRVPFSQMRWQFLLDGYDPVEIVPNPFPANVRLVPAGTAPPDMVRVPAGEFERARDRTSVELPEYWIDTFEVSNRQFKAFVDGGGYRTREHWVEPFAKDGRTLEWDEAMALFRDTTGRPGPSTWELGTYPDGQDDWR